MGIIYIYDIYNIYVIYRPIYNYIYIYSIHQPIHQTTAVDCPLLAIVAYDHSFSVLQYTAM